MNTRCFPAAVIAAATSVVLLGWATPAIAQESAAPPADSVASTAASPPPLSTGGEDVLKLSRAKISDDVTIAFIENGNRRYAPTASEILYLKSAGVSDRVLAAMLNQQSRGSGAPTAPPAIAPPLHASASAPQYIAPPATTFVEQTPPASTVYVVGTTPSYYSFYDPWPYWYDPWPYYYPYASLGFYWGWGGCYYGWNNYYPNGHYGHAGRDGRNGGNGRYGNNGNHNPSQAHGDGQSPGGHRPNSGQPPNGNPRPQNGGSQPGGEPGMYASGGRSPGVAGQPRSDTTRPAGTAPTGRPTSNWSNNGNPSTGARSSQPNAFASRSGQAGVVTSSLGPGANGRNIASPNRSQFGGQTSPAVSVSRGASPWSTATGSATALTRPGAQMGNGYARSPAATPQRSSISPSSSYRASGNVASMGRPATVSSSGGAMNSGGFRGGGSYSGGSAPRMSSGSGYQGGGGFRGGGAGGGGGGSHGGGGGGSRR